MSAKYDAVLERVAGGRQRRRRLRVPSTCRRSTAGTPMPGGRRPPPTRQARPRVVVDGSRSSWGSSSVPGPSWSACGSSRRRALVSVGSSSIVADAAGCRRRPPMTRSSPGSRRRRRRQPAMMAQHPDEHDARRPSSGFVSPQPARHPASVTQTSCERLIKCADSADVEPSSPPRPSGRCRRAGRRLAGLKSVPMRVGDREQTGLGELVVRDAEQLGRLLARRRASGGSSSTPSRGHARGRASMKLHTAGSNEPQQPAAADDGTLSRRPSMHGISITGTRWKFSVR